MQRAVKPILFVLALAAAGSLPAAGWERQSSGVLFDLKAVVFKNERSGWSVGDPSYPNVAVIVHTSDGGASWSAQFRLSDIRLSDMDFADSLNGIAVGFTEREGLPLTLTVTTTNGGDSWIPNPPSDDFEFWYDLCRFPDLQTLWVTGHTHMLWPTIEDEYVKPLLGAGQEYDQDFADFRGLAIDSSTIWVVGSDGGGSDEILKTTDLGDTWFLASGPIDSTCHLNTCDFINRELGWVTANPGHIFRTTDGGFNWTVQYRETCQVLNRITFVDPLNGWVAGNRGLILRTRDGGAHWAAESTRVSVNLNAVSAVDTMNAWAAGDSGTIIHYAPSVDVTESRSREESGLDTRHTLPAATISRGTLQLGASSSQKARTRNGAALLDISGRKVMSLHPGPNDVSRFAPGVYFVLAGQDRTWKVIIQR